MVLQRDKNVEVVISGIGGYFPRAKNIAEFQQVLMDKIECIDDARWKAGQLDLSDKTGNIDQINYFDISYFGIHRQQAVYMDPMSRMTLQNTLEAVIDAGVNPVSLRGKKVLVSIASCISENDSLMFENVENGFGVTGQARGMLSNRISYWLNVTGPSYSVDSSWLGGMEVLKHAVEAIQSGLCESAVVGNANLAMNIYPTYLMKLLKFISPDGHTRSFQENADGYVRSDAVCVFFIQKAKDAKRHYAKIVDVDTLFEGYRTGQFVNLNMDGARKFLTNFYQRVQIDPKTINYIESYGSGLKIIDQFELKLLEDVFGSDNRDHPLYIGAVKKNVGHSEASCVFTSIVKAIISMESGIIPANFSLPEEVNHNIRLNKGLKHVTEHTTWNSDYVAVNGYGLSSSYGHILLEKNHVEQRNAFNNLPLLYMLSTRSEDGIKSIIETVKSQNGKFDFDYMNIVNSVFKTSIPGYLYRGYLVKSTENSVKEEFTHFNALNRPIWFVYSGMGSQWPTMGKSLMNLPIFARAINKCAAALEPYGVDLIKILTSDDKSLFDNILNSFVGIAAIQIGLTDVLHALGINPDGLIGHSVGELGCAYADSCLTAEQMVLAAYFRGRASQEAELIPGLMAAVGVGATQAKKFVPPSVDIACHNGPDSSTLSGPKKDMEVLVEQLQKSGVFARLVNVAGIAYHSRYIRPAAPLLIEYMRKLIPEPKKRSSKWLSSSVPEEQWNSDLAQYVSAEYLTNNLLSSVLFEEVLKKVPKDAVLIEIAPHGLLQAILKRSVHAKAENVALTKRDSSNGLEFLFQAIGKLYLTGVPLNISALYDDIQTENAVVPRGTPPLAPLTAWIHTERWRTGLDEFRDYSNCEESFSLDSHGEWFRDVVGHRFYNMPLIPGTSYLPLVAKILTNTHRLEAVEFSNIFFVRQRILPLTNEYIPPVRIMVQRGTGSFEVSDRYGIVASGKATVLEKIEQQKLQKYFDEFKIEDYQLGETICHLNEDSIYNEIATRGLDLKGIYRCIKEVDIKEHGVIATIIWKNKWSVFAAAALHLKLLYHSDINDKNIVPGYIHQLSIIFENLPEENTIVRVQYNNFTKVFSSPILHMFNAKSIPATLNQDKYLASTVEFIPHINNNNFNLNSIFKLCLQIIDQQKFEINTKISVYVYNNKYTKHIRNLLESLQEIEYHFVTSRFWSNSEKISSCDLLIIGEEDISNISKYYQFNSNAHILLCSSTKNINLNYDFIQVLNHQESDFNYSFVKQIRKEEFVIVNGPQMPVKIEDLDLSSFEWVRNLQSHLKNEEISRIFLSFDYLPISNLNLFFQAIKELPNGHKIRLIFILDHNAPKCTANEDFYMKIFQQDLILATFANGKWGSFTFDFLQFTSQELQEKESYQKKEQIFTYLDKNFETSDLEVKYIGFPLTSNTINETNNVSSIPIMDYSGINCITNEKVMGILDSNFKPDPILQWTLPKNWDLTDGATIPCNYALAYYIIFQLAELTAGETILIHNVANAFGRALKNVAVSLQADVLVTVNTEDEKGFLLKNRIIDEECILDANSAKLEQEIWRTTNGRGVDVFINCFNDKRLHRGLRCLANFSRVILLQDSLNSVNPQDMIGLSTFSRCLGMHGVQFQKILQLPTHTKQKIQKFVQDGIIDEVVITNLKTILDDQPSWKTIVKHVAKFETINSLILPIQIRQPFNKVFKSYAVVAGEKTPVEFIISTAVWLNNKNAKSINIFIPKQNLSELKQLQKRLISFELSIYVNEELLKELKYDAIIVLPQASLPETASGVKQVICTGSGIDSALTFYPHRSIIRWKSDNHYLNSMHFINYALHRNVDLKIIRNNQDNQHMEDNPTNKIFTYKDFFRYLAYSVPSLISVDIINDLNTVVVQQISNAQPRIITDSPPVFLVPGLLGNKCRYLQHTLSKLLCPVYIINAGRLEDYSVEQFAADAIKKIQDIYPKGPYNIVGVSTGGILSIEITYQLVKLYGNEHVQLYLLDSEPETLQNLLQGTIINDNSNLDKLILHNLLKLNERKDLDILNSQNTKWSDLMNEAIKPCNFSNWEDIHARKVLNVVRNHLQQVMNYKINKTQLHAPVKIIRPSETNRDFNISSNPYYKQLDVHIVKGNHFTMLNTNQVAEYINENFIVPGVYA